jgi:N-dimethylarginine dimethylaminohydrolase
MTGKNKIVEDELDKLGINVIHWRFRHQYFWDGGIHCLTSDVQREGDCEDYIK